MPREYSATLPIRGVAQPDVSEQLGDARLRDRRREPVERRGVAEVVSPGHVSVEPDVVGQVPDATLDGEGRARRVQPVDAGFPGRRLGKAEEHEDRRRLARAVRTEETEDLPGLDHEVEVIHRRHLAVALAEADRFDGRHHRRPNRRKA